MAKQRGMLPARKQSDRSRDDESLLLRSAESLGRMIGTLQRQLDGATRRMSASAESVVDNLPAMPLGTGTSARRRTAKKGKKTSGRAAAASRPRGAGPRATATRARKSASRTSKKR